MPSAASEASLCIQSEKRQSNVSATTKYRDNADLVLAKTLDVHVSEENLYEQIWSIVNTLCPFLDENDSISDNDDPTMPVSTSHKVAMMINTSALTIKPLTGGLSNELFIVRTSHPQGVLVRIHPSIGGDLLIDREKENKLVAWLSSQGIGPTYYGRFTNGRVEEFYPNVTPLSCHEMAQFAPQIASHMADFHNLRAPNNILPKPNCLEKSSHFVAIDAWFAAVFNRLGQSTEGVNGEEKDEIKLSQEMHKEWMWVKDCLGENGSKEVINDRSPVKCKALKFIREMVLTHQDCQSLNILKDTSVPSSESIKHDIKLIDFEYSGWNPRAADIANTFCEHCDMNNLCARYENEYPSEHDQNVFLKAYVARADPILAAGHVNTGDHSNVDPKTEEEFLSTLRHEIARFTLLSHVGWAVWAVLKNLEDSGIDFDYLEYARHRMDGYKLFKSLYC